MNWPSTLFLSWRPLLHTRSRASVDSVTVVAREILLDLESRTWVVFCGPLGLVFRPDRFFVSDRRVAEAIGPRSLHNSRTTPCQFPPARRKRGRIDEFILLDNKTILVVVVWLLGQQPTREGHSVHFMESLCCSVADYRGSKNLGSSFAGN